MIKAFNYTHFIIYTLSPCSPSLQSSLHKLFADQIFPLTLVHFTAFLFSFADLEVYMNGSTLCRVPFNLHPYYYAIISTRNAKYSLVLRYAV